MSKRITLEQISASLYNVLIDGRQSTLSVYFENGEFHCYQKDFINIKTKTLCEMKELLGLEIE